MRKLAAFLLFLSLLIVACAALADPWEILTEGDWEYVVLEDGTAELHKYTGSAESLEIPGEIGGKKVTLLGNESLAWCSSLESVVIPEGVTRIGDSAFSHCRNLARITIPDTVRDIGPDAFYTCSSLNGVTLPKGLSRISRMMFDQCISLTEIVIPDGVTVIEEAAFNRCRSLVSVSIPDSVTDIEDFAFCECNSLESITLPEGITRLSVRLFDSCFRLGEIRIPDSVKIIDAGAFSHCNSLFRVRIPSGTVRIGNLAFWQCPLLVSVEIPDSVTEIGKDAFSACPDLTAVVSPSSAAEKYCMENGVPFISPGDEPPVPFLENYSYTILADGTAEITDFYVPVPELVIPRELDGLPVSSLGDRVFNNNPGLIIVTIPDSVTRVGANPFFFCRKLTDIRVSSDHPALEVRDGVLFSRADKRLVSFPCAFTGESYAVPEGTEVVGDNAFSGCESLRTVEIPEGVIRIGSGAFLACSSLESISVPDSIALVGDNPFVRCGSLADLRISPDHPYLEVKDGLLFSKPDSRLIGWFNAFPAGDYDIPEGTAKIGAAALAYSALRNVTIPDSVTVIGSYAFFGCESLQSVTVPDSVTEIGESAFDECPGLVLTVSPGSEAERYCIGNSLSYVYPEGD